MCRWWTAFARKRPQVGQHVGALDESHLSDVHECPSSVAASVAATTSKRWNLPARNGRAGTCDGSQSAVSNWVHESRPNKPVCHHELRSVPSFVR
jgi:hypothetical protein